MSIRTLGLAVLLSIPLWFAGFAVYSIVDAYSAKPIRAHGGRVCASKACYRKALAWQRKDRRHLRRLLAERHASSVATGFRLAEIVYGMPRAGARTIGRCESGLDPYAYNSATASGVMQILASTMKRTPYAQLSTFDPIVNILAAGFIWRQDGGSFREWTCSRITGVR